MADLTLSSGREITFDMAALSLREYRALFDKKQPQADEDAIVARICGLEFDDYLNLPYEDWRRVLMAFFKKARASIDPN